jgi:hypothetical protein
MTDKEYIIELLNRSIQIANERLEKSQSANEYNFYKGKIAGYQHILSQIDNP